MTDDQQPLHWRSASDLAAAIRSRELSCVEVVGAFLDRIEALDGDYHAFLSLLPRREALALAGQADAAVARGDTLGLVHGLPIGVKDLMDVQGLPTTHGTKITAQKAAQDSMLARRLKLAGAIIIGKTNTPEHGLGTLTVNRLGPPALNPWDPARHAGGSSGGAAVAVAAGMLPFADGSDSGGSIRYPASFCNLVGLRPSPGRVPSGRLGDGWSPHGVLGPMARHVRDAGLLLAAMSGCDRMAPLSVPSPTREYVDPHPCDLAGLRVGWSADLGGLPLVPRCGACWPSSAGSWSRWAARCRMSIWRWSGPMDVGRSSRCSISSPPAVRMWRGIEMSCAPIWYAMSIKAPR